MSPRFLKYACLVVVLALWSVTIMAEDVKFPRSVALQFLSKPSDTNNSKMTIKIGPKDRLSEGSYQINSQISLSTETISDVINSHSFALQEVQNDISFLGWIKQGNSYCNIPKWSYLPSLRLSFNDISGNAKPINLVNFDELWFDFESKNGDNCAVTLRMDFDNIEKRNVGAKRKNYRALSGDDKNLLPLSRILVAKKDWFPRDRMYLVKRKLGLGFDENWYYLRHEKNTVIERRFHQDLKKGGVVDLWFAPGTKIEGGHVGVSWKNHLKSDAFFDWVAIPKLIESSHVRLYLRDIAAINARLSAKKAKDRQAFLSELALEVRGNAKKISVSRPLRELIFQGEKKHLGQSKSTINLPRHKESLSANTKRLVVDLHPLINGNHQLLKFLNGMIFVQSVDTNNLCMIRPLSIRLVSLGKKQRPLVLGEMFRFDQSLGGPFLKLVDDKNEVEWVLRDASLPFTELTPNDLMENKEGVFSPWGINLLRDSQIKQIKMAKGGIVLQGNGGSLTLIWRHPIRITRETRVILKMIGGSAFVEDATIGFQFQDGEQEVMQFSPNQVLLLGNVQKEGKILQQVTIYLKMQEKPYHVVLKEFFVFHPTLIQKSQLFHMPHINREVIPLKIEAVQDQNQILVPSQGKGLRGITKGSNFADIVWQTPVAQPAQVLDVLKLRYHLSRSPMERCWLTVFIQGEHHSSTQTICSNQIETTLSVPLTSLLRDFDPDEKVVFIKWHAHIVPFAMGDISFYFEPALMLESSSSISTIFKDYPLFEINQQINASIELSEQAIGHLSNGNSVWINLGAMNMLPWYFSLKPLNAYPYIEVKQILMKSDVPPTHRQWLRALGKGQEKPGRGLQLKLLVLSGLIILLAWLKFEEIQRSGNNALNKLRVIEKLYTKRFWRFFLWLDNTLTEFKKTLNRVMGILVVIGLAVVNALGFSSDYNLMGFFLLLGIGVLWYGWRWYGLPKTLSHDPASYWFGSADSIAPVVLTMTSITIAWTAWQLGHKITMGAFLPMIAMGYYYFPWWRKFELKRWWDSISLCFWMVITVGFYFLGIHYNPNHLENYYFTFGSISAVLIWRSCLREAHGFIASHWPFVAKIIYSRTGSRYFVAALINLALVSLLLMIRRDLIADQIATVAYYLLAVGLFWEILACRQRMKNSK